MGPYTDSAAWALVGHLCGQLVPTHRLATLFPPSIDMAAHQLGWGLGLSLAGAVMGGISVALASKKERPSARHSIGKDLFDLEHQRFLAACESSLDAFYVLDCVRDAHGSIVDFTFRYLNSQAEHLINAKRQDMLGRSYKTAEIPILDEQNLECYFETAATGVPLTLEFEVPAQFAGPAWLRHKAVKLDDGIAVTSSDITEFKSVKERFQSVAEFSGMIFDHSPFSIIATDANGMITAMNHEAQILTGYAANELIDKTSLLRLYDPDELRELAERIAIEQGLFLEGLDLIAGSVEHSQSRQFLPSNSANSDLFRSGRKDEQLPEREWVLVRRDGTRISVSIAMKVLRDQTGERTGLILTAYDVTARRQATYRVAAATMRDPLTGLIGRSLLEDRIAQAIKRSERAKNKLAVLTIDLDHFKRINDELGHRIGDEVLATAAARLADKVRSADTLARIGGDEFIIVISDQANNSDIEFCADLFLRAIAAPYNVQGHIIDVTASMGISICPDLADETEHLLRRSEAAMYAAKEAGRNRSLLFAPTMLEDASSRLSMEGALRQALDRNELFLEYQPQVALPSGEVIGMESLMRWRHPRYGLVSPAHFIPIVEKIGLLPEFGEWAMRTACREAKWIQTRLGRRLSLSVNLSPNQFQQKRLLRTIQDSLQSSGLEASDLEIEIIESTLMIDSTENLATLQMIRDLGVHLSIDDFGTGFCNFNYLLQYQVDRLKIDQSFVRQAATDGSAASVVRTVIAMAHGLGIKIIAEGVETRDQLKFLMRRRCDQAQGYFFARPLSPEQFVQAVSRIEAMNLNEPSGEHAIRKLASDSKPGTAAASVKTRSGYIPTAEFRIPVSIP